MLSSVDRQTGSHWQTLGHTSVHYSTATTLCLLQASTSGNVWGRIKKSRPAKLVLNNPELLASEPFRARFRDVMSESLSEVNANIFSQLGIHLP